MLTYRQYGDKIQRRFTTMKYDVWIAIHTNKGSHRRIQVDAENKEQAEEKAIAKYLNSRRVVRDFEVLGVYKA